MRTFADLLTFYMERTGIGDAELARRIPVSRPTLVRWREGVTTRPRYREDVARCAELLRLTPSETDEFLLAAGFSPETAPSPSPSASSADDEEEEPREPSPPGGEDQDTPEISPALEGRTSEPAPTTPEDEDDAGQPFKRRGVLAAIAIGFLVVAGAAVAATLILRDDAVYPAAAGGESLIVMSPFVNYTGGQQGYNVLGRLKDEIDNEVYAAGLSGVRAVEWPKQISSEPDAEEASRRSAAVVVIWGEYDSGRVIARFTTHRARSTQLDQQVVNIASSPSDLPATINAELTEQVRYVALLTLGQLYMERGEFDLAKTALLHAADQNPTDPATLANLRFQLGRAYLGGDFADYDEAIWLFTQALAARPKSVEALNSRAIAYLERGRAGDVERAIDDLVHALTIGPDRAATYVNLAAAYVERGTEADLDRAIAELTDALRIEPEYASAYVNRAGAYVARGGPGDIERAFEDIDAALDSEPDLSAAYLVRGNAYIARNSQGDMGLAEAEFSRAIALAPDSPTAYYNRALVHSELGNMPGSLSDLRRAQMLDPNEADYSRILCWQMAVSGSPQEALRYCERAVAQGPSGQAREGRGLAHALSGRDEKAIADFEAFLAWVDASPKDSCRETYHQSRAGWIEELRSGEDPFDANTLRELRIRPVSPGAAPC